MVSKVETQPLILVYRNIVYCHTLFLYSRGTDYLPFTYFRINLNEFKKNTRIKADYLALLHSSENEKKFVYYFLIHSYLYELPNRFVSCSLFRKQDKDYLRGTSKTTILLMEKIVNIDKNEVIELYRNPNYK